MIILDKREEIKFLKNGNSIVELNNKLYVVYNNLWLCDEVTIYDFKRDISNDQLYGCDHPEGYPKYVHDELRKIVIKKYFS